MSSIKKHQLTKAETLLRLLIIKNDICRVKELLQEKPLGISSTDLGKHLRHILHHNLSIEIASLIIKAGADVKVTNSLHPRQKSYLYDLLSEKNPDYHRLALLMMDQMKDVKASDIYTNMLSSSDVGKYWSANTIKRLLNAIPDLIHEACGRQLVNNIKVLLRHGVDINVKNSLGQTPFSLIKFDRRPLFRDAHRILVRHMAVLVSDGHTINDCDLKIIESHDELLRYYNQCLDELKLIKTTTIIRGVTYFCLLKMNVGKLTFMLRNNYFVKRFKRSKRCKKFPIFNEDLDFSYKLAEIRQKDLIDREEAICESLKYNLTYESLEKIIYYMYTIDDVE